MKHTANHAFAFLVALMLTGFLFHTVVSIPANETFSPVEITQIA